MDLVAGLAAACLVEADASIDFFNQLDALSIVGNGLGGAERAGPVRVVGLAAQDRRE